jgi:predicted nucleic acid-binding protein
MSLIVLDASVAAKWYVRENDSERAQALIDRGLLFAAPDIFFAEVANALRKQHREDGQLDAASVRLAVDDLLRVGVESVSSSILLQRATEISLTLNHPVYDCLYLCLAERRNTVVVTADKKLCGRVGGSEWAHCIVFLADAEKIV